MVTQVILTSSNGLFDTIWLVVLQIIVELLQFGLKFLVSAVDPAELQRRHRPVSGTLVRSSDSDVREVSSSSGSALAIGGPRHYVRQLPVQSLVQGCVISILTMTERNLSKLIANILHLKLT